MTKIVMLHLISVILRNGILCAFDNAMASCDANASLNASMLHLSNIHLDLWNAVVTLTMSSASCDTCTIANGIHMFKLHLISTILTWGLQWHQWHLMSRKLCFTSLWASLANRFNWQCYQHHMILMQKPNSSHDQKMMLHSTYPN